MNIEGRFSEIQHAINVRDRGLVTVLLQMEGQVQYLKARLLEVGVRLHALDGLTPTLPEWPRIVVPEVFKGVMEDM